MAGLIERRTVVGALLAATAQQTALPAAAAGWMDRTFRSDDGAIIHYRVRGRGPGVVVVHGAFDQPDVWYPACEPLTGRFRFLILRRRGWMSPPPDDGTRPYEREKGDIARLLAIAGPGAALFGHSAGGALVADYARTHGLTSRLVMFEPVLPLGGPVAGPWLPRLRRLVAQGRRDAAFRMFLEKIVQIPEPDVLRMVGTPDWRRQAALMRNGLRELAAIDALPAEPRAYASIEAPTRLIVAELSPDHPFHDASRALARVLPNVQVRVFKGQGHMGMASAPSAFAQLLGACLTT